MSEDTRYPWLAEKALQVLGIKQEQWTALMDTEHRQAVQVFLEDENTQRLLIYPDGKDIVATQTPPQKFKSKRNMFFSKLRPEKVVKENIEQLIIYGEFSDQPLETLNTLASKLYLPLLSRPATQEGWPEVVVKEIVDNMHKFIANLSVTIGQQKGKTILPVPIVEPKEDCTKDKDTVHRLESAIVTWTKQIKQVLQSDPDAAVNVPGEYPGPMTEIEYWQKRASDIESIHQQISSEKVQKVTKILQLAQSTYSSSFQRLVGELEEARLMANDAVRFLEPLTPYFDKLSLMDDFQGLQELFKPIIHILMLIWKHCKVYKSSSRLVTVIREICNDLIMQARKFIPGEELIKMDPQEAVDKLKQTIRLIGSFKAFYGEYKIRSVTECEIPWKFQNNALFSRLDAFLSRCHDMLELQTTCVAFAKLERVEIGGTQGKILTSTVKQIYQKYLDALELFQQVEYDIMDTDAKNFQTDFDQFCDTIVELERRLGAVIVQAFDSCTTITMTFKLLDSFEGLLDRDRIVSDLEIKHVDLLKSYGEELREVHDIFNNYMQNPMLSKNAAPHSGAVAWVRGLEERIREPMNKIRNVHQDNNIEEYRDIMQLYESITSSITEYEGKTVAAWCDQVCTISDQKLNQSLLTKEENNQNLNLLAVNFDPDLVKLLRETKYFLLLKIDVPESALKIFERVDTFRQQIGNLDLIVGIYNKIQKTVLDVEVPLVKDKLVHVDLALNKGLETLNWNSSNINDYISEVMLMVKEVDGILRVLKDDVKQTQDKLAEWSSKLMFERKEGKTYNFEELQQSISHVMQTRHSAIKDDGKQIVKFMSNSNRTVKVSKGSQAWRNYIEFVSEIVIDGLADAIIATVKYVFNQLDPNYMQIHDYPPLLEVRLELIPPLIVSQPDLGHGNDDGPGVKTVFNKLLKQLMSIGTLMKRLDIGEGDYSIELEEDTDILDSISSLNGLILANEADCDRFKQQFMKYEYLFTKDLNQTLQDFLESEGGTHEDGSPKEPPLSTFDTEIAKYKSIQEEINSLPTSATIGWLKVDAKPVVKALSTWASKWVYLFTHYLQDKVTSNMEELYEFMQVGGDTLDVKVGKETNEDEEGEEAETEEQIEGEEAEQAKQQQEEQTRQALYKVMSCMRDIRKRTERTDSMFEPLKETVGLLQGYGISIGEKTLKQLEEGPLQWKGLKKKMFQRREQLAPLQQAEAIEVRRRSDAFGIRVDEFRKFFQSNAPFTVSGSELSLDDVKPAYKMLDNFHHGSIEGNPSVIQIIAESKTLQENQELFELYVSDYLMLKRCNEELSYLKSLWDMVATVMFTVTDWHRTPWSKINVDFLVDETKKLQKDVKQLNKSVRLYEVYRLLEESLKNMQVSLPLVQDLARPAMRDRHWKQLMEATGKKFVMDEKFCLGDLLALELHKFQDDCGEIVERADKELIIEKNLNKIQDTWSAMDLAFTNYMDTETMQLNVDDVITECLEGDNLILQGMSANKYVQTNAKFFELVTNWQSKLTTVDTVLNTWKEVQKKWQALESIFVGSADIRVQLPEDSKRFDGINADYQDLMRSAPEILNVVEACNVEGRQERLEIIQTGLEMCEKALQDYLETKRMAFPRFYFVAAADLLDILSKGSNPAAIMRHLPRNFDNVHNLEFKKNEAGEVTKAAIGMYSGEGEFVPFFHGDCMCDGPVENWLQNVVDAMKQALRVEYRATFKTYDEKPRKQWIFDPSTQNTVIVSRTFYTQEVNEAFDELEEGNEDALKGEYDKQVNQLAELIDLINGKLTGLERKKLITLCTIDVHARDVIQRLIDERVEDSTCFQWQSQLRYYQNERTKDCQVNICDAEIIYNYEYIGNCGCLCITPLTDRCYITLTQAQRLVLGGAPAGPAGTGKTETTKDLARSLGVQIYVFNCSDQMDYKAMGQIYKGLAQTGAWGCFDEFNRIPVAVLSVCSTQYKTVLDALRAHKEKFIFEDVEMPIKPTVMAFITMNPGYPGRAELPESLKALFRPVSMVLPDLALICEIMLMAEGFQMSKILSRKFVILYRLCEDLLSKSRHYDWKLRAIKTTLYVAGGMKRDAPELSEDKVLLRALRDFNLGKLTSDDTSIFMGLLNDLFPRTLEHVPRAVDQHFDNKVKDAARKLNLQPDETFCLKISQLREIFVVRWSVFLLGPAGCGKTKIWKTLKETQDMLGEKTSFKPINPKAVTRNELYGYLHPSTREWKEGLISVNFRDMANNKTHAHQWIVLDGDIDAEWIESMNTVMDDNKMLTLASNERIPLTPTMRLLLEINHMVHCSPATVSRGGVIFVNAEDVGWKPCVDSWLDWLENVDEGRGLTEHKPLLSTLFQRYCDSSMEYCRRNFKTVVFLPYVSQVQTICKILEGILPKEKVKGAPPPDKKLLEYQFVFACVWAFGSTMLVDKVSDYRTQFSKWWVSEWKNVQFPEKGLVYDYCVDEEQCLMVPWDDKVQPFQYFPDNFGNLFVPTVETTRLTYFLDSLIDNHYYVMFVGNTGTGKTALMMNKLRNMDQDIMSYSVINLNSFSDAPAMQVNLEKPLVKKTGVRFGPPGSKRMVFFMDDLNMPYVDKYDTQSAIEIARQFVDYRGWFDKVKIQFKDILSSQYAAAMNPTAGSFQITPRMQRHFATFAVQMPSQEIVRSVYLQILEGHASVLDPDVAKYAPKLIDATVDLHKQVMNTFLPSAVKFHYQFNMRDLSNITQGLCRTVKEYYKEPLVFGRLWIHECERVFRDRMVSETDMTKFDELRAATTKKYLDDLGMPNLEQRPLLFGSFMTMSGDDVPIYNQVEGYEELNKTLTEKLAEHNESNAAMDLVLFQQAMEHICRITRIIDQPRGNAMLVGVGGSGKQSLARLASFICGFEVFQISVSSTYGINDFKENLLSLYQKAGVKNQPVAFLMTDNQIVKEEMLVFLNDLLSTGVTDVFTQEDKDTFSNAVRGDVKTAGLVDTAENCWDFFIEKCRKYLHVILCFSPVGDKFRVRARQFPALVNCTVFDWFHGWPHEALVSVANRFLGDVEGIEDADKEAVGYHMAFAHQSVGEASTRYLQQSRRYNYTTPKSYLELISLYKSLLQRKRSELKAAKERLENGVEKIAQASSQVADLQVALKEEQLIVEEKKAKTDELIVDIGKEKAIVDQAVEAGREDEEAATLLQSEVMEFKDVCDRDLAAAEPVIKEAEAALNSLDKGSLGELKSFGSPAAEIVQVVSACMVLTAAGGKIPKDLTWQAGKKFMGNVDAFLKQLINFDKDNVPENCVDTVEKQFMSNPNFTPDFIRSKSSAAAGLCGWVVNICKYFRIYQVVAPKRAALLEANKKLESANKKLSGIRAKVKELQDRVAALEANLMKATEDKNLAIAQAEKTQQKAKLADRLINGLSGENKRWSEEIVRMGVTEGKLVGDVLLAAAFVSYAGPFNMQFRVQLVEEKWLIDLTERSIPMTKGVKPLDMLTSDSQKAKWANEGLPTDPLSVGNGAIMTNASRWPLVIDPQLQGIKWVRNRFPDMTILQQSQPKYLDKLINAIEQGLPLMLENLPEDIDAVLDPVIGKQTSKRGRNIIMKIGDNEVTYDNNFQLFMQTKLANPHYKPEINAQASLLNFCVTEKGLEEQLLALVVEHERPDLQEQALELVKALGQYTITLTELEDNLLFRLANSQGDILEDIELIENLEETKRTAVDIEEKVQLAKQTELDINNAREVYRMVATRGSLVYFLIDNLNALDRVYHYSMANFVFVLKKGMDVTPGGKDESLVPEDQRIGEEVPVEDRVQRLTDTVSYIIFAYVSQGLFERHKLIVATQMCMTILRSRGELQQQQFQYLLRGPKQGGTENPLQEWISNSVWESVQALKEIEEYSSLPDDLVGSSKRWREWIELERPEDEPLPGDWKRMPEFERLLLFRALRPDRLTAAMSKFVSNTIGKKFTKSLQFDLERSYQDMAPGTPIFVFLSPGVDVAASVEALGNKLGFTLENGRYASVSLGQGQEEPAMRYLNQAHKNGGWVLLQNIHLTIDWTAGDLEKKVDKLMEGAHEDFRLFLSAEPPPVLERALPISILQASIKLTNEPPEGMQANLLRAYGQFNEELLEQCSKQSEFRSIIFALSYFHAAIIERKKFGVGNIPNATSGIGWNMNYPFNTGDLLCCAQQAVNYLENNVKVPWDDLRYLFGEIMYGGHIVEDWDRRLANGYLCKYFNESLLEGFDMFPQFPTPNSAFNHKSVMEYIQDSMPPETALAFGLHPNAEIGFKLREADSFCSNVLQLQPRETGGEGVLPIEERAKMVLDEVVDKLPEQFDMEDIRGRVDEYSPYVMVAIQESERMNILLAEIKRSLMELDLGLRGDLTMTEPMEKLMHAIANDAVPANWTALAYHSLRPLGSWLRNLLERVQQLVEWTTELNIPKVVWLSGLFNPQSFLTAVMQTTARRNDWPLDKTVILTEVTKKNREQIDAPSRDGAFIDGLTLEGARWDDKAGVLDESKPKELFSQIPVILVRAVTVDKAELKDAYQCPVYVTEARFRQEVFTAQLKSKHSWIKWTLSGVCMFLDVVS